jgi:hypothetical protein
LSIPLMLLWSSFSLWCGILSISSCAFWPFVPLPLRKLCSVHLSISSLSHWFFGNLSCQFWLLIPCKMHSWERFSSVLWSASSVWWLFPLLCRRFLVSYSPI